MPKNAAIEIRPPRKEDYEAWRILYNGYATFYKREMTNQIAANVWQWLHNPNHELDGLLAFADGKAIGLAHYRRMPSPLRGADIGFLDDLFVTPDARGTGAAPAMFEELQNIAKTRKWEMIRWLTADNNYAARSLYDKLAVKAGWNVYEMKN